MTETNKNTAYHIMSAIATAVEQSKEFSNSKRLNSYEEEKEKPYWVEWNDPISSVRCKFKDNKLILTFTEEIANPLRLTTSNEYVNKINNKVSEIVSSLKKKYKEITSKTLSLTQVGDILERQHPLSLKRQIRDYTVIYTIGGIESVSKKNEKDLKDLSDDVKSKIDSMFPFRSKK